MLITEESTEDEDNFTQMWSSIKKKKVVKEIKW